MIQIRDCPIVHSASSRDDVFVLNDEQEWICISRTSLSARQLPALDGVVADATVHNNELVASLYRSEVAWFRDNQWSTTAVDSAILAMVTTKAGLIAGDMLGNVFTPGDNAQPFACLDDSVTELLYLDDDIVILTRDGALHAGPLDRSERVTPLAVRTEQTGTIRGLFAGGPPGRVGIHSSHRIAELDANSDWSAAVSQPFPNPLYRVARCGVDSRYVVLTDKGQVWMADLREDFIRIIELPEGDRACGLAPDFGGRVSVWTQSGRLFDIEDTGHFVEAHERSVFFVRPDSDTRQLVLTRTKDGSLNCRHRDLTSAGSGSP